MINKPSRVEDVIKSLEPVGNARLIPTPPVDPFARVLREISQEIKKQELEEPVDPSNFQNSRQDLIEMVSILIRQIMAIDKTNI